jgi:hypothetical protein
MEMATVHWRQARLVFQIDFKLSRQFPFNCHLDNADIFFYMFFSIIESVIITS